jgi:hypothetical protein
MGLSTDIEESAFGSGLRGQQKGKRSLLKPLAKTRTQGLKLLEERSLGVVMFQDIGDQVSHIADPARLVGPQAGVMNFLFILPP